MLKEEGTEEWDEVEVAPKLMLMFQHKEWTVEELLVFLLSTSAKKLCPRLWKQAISQTLLRLLFKHHFTVSVNQYLLASFHTFPLIVSFSCSFPPSCAFTPQIASQSCLGLCWFICSFPHRTGIWSFRFASLYSKPALPRSCESLTFVCNCITPVTSLQDHSAHCVPGY